MSELTWDAVAQNAAIYADGRPLRGDNYAYAFTPLQQRMTLGSTLEGHMDEVRLYDRAFSAVVAALE